MVALPFPKGTFLPVTTFGDKFPLDDLIRPFLFRFAPMALVSYPYATALPKRVELPLFLDSGGFAGSLAGATYEYHEDHFALRTPEGLLIDPLGLLQLAEVHSSIRAVATLDAFIPAVIEEEQRQSRFEWTLKNAAFMVKHRKQADLFVYGSLQAWDFASGKAGTEALREIGVDGIAVGGMVPRAGRREEMGEILAGVLAGAGELPVHVFGLGQPEVVRWLFGLGVWSVDSSGYVRQAVGERYWHADQGSYVSLAVLNPSNSCKCVVCRSGVQNFDIGGLWGKSRLALHNLNAYALK
ncbi:MAG: hypothetical protein AAF572_29015 [Cyanobacteria bacterium P01_B01_bin.77]